MVTFEITDDSYWIGDDFYETYNTNDPVLGSRGSYYRLEELLKDIANLYNIDVIAPCVEDMELVVYNEALKEAGVEVYIDNELMIGKLRG